MSWSYLPERAPGCLNGMYPCENKYACTRTVKKPGLCLRCRQMKKDGGYVNEMLRRGHGWREAIASWKQQQISVISKNEGYITRRRPNTNENQNSTTDTVS